MISTQIKMINQQIPWYLQEPFQPCRMQNLVLWVNSSSWDGTTWRNLAPSYSNVNHGTLKNGVAIGDLIHPSGVFGAPRKFDGSGDYVNCGNDSSLSITDAITLEAWVKVNDATSRDPIIAKRVGGAGEGVYELDIRLSTHNFGFSYTNAAGNWEEIQSTSSVTSEIWHHLVASINSPGTSVLYLDGVVAKTTILVNTLVVNTHSIYIGNFSTHYFNGLIYGVKIYNWGLSASDVVHNHTHSPIYYMQHGIDPMSLLNQSANEIARVVA